MTDGQQVNQWGALVDRASTADSKPATQKQIVFLRALLRDVEEPVADFNSTVRTAISASNGLPQATASRCITLLIRLRDAETESVPF